MTKPYKLAPILPCGFKMFVCSYEARGARWGVTLPALSWEDAEQCMEDAFEDGRVDGVLHGTIDL